MRVIPGWSPEEGVGIPGAGVTVSHSTGLTEAELGFLARTTYASNH